jgi:hypothetical protein
VTCTLNLKPERQGLTKRGRLKTTSSALTLNKRAKKSRIMDPPLGQLALLPPQSEILSTVMYDCPYVAGAEFNLVVTPFDSDGKHTVLIRAKVLEVLAINWSTTMK